MEGTQSCHIIAVVIHHLVCETGKAGERESKDFAGRTYGPVSSLSHFFCRTGKGRGKTYRTYTAEMPEGVTLSLLSQLVLKGKFTRKWKFTLYTRHDADGGVGEVFESANHFWSLRGKQCFSQSDLSCKVTTWRGHNWLELYRIRLQRCFVYSNISPPPPSIGIVMII